MNRPFDFVRRHVRLFAGLVVSILAAGGAVALGSAGAVPAQAPRTAAKAPHAVVAAAVAHVSSRSSAPAVVPVAARTTVRSNSARSGSHHAAGALARPGIPATPPTSRAVALALRKTTGLSPSQVTVRQLCPAVGSGHARCAAEALVLRSNGAFVHPRVARASSGGPSLGDAPAYLQQAYDLSSLAQTGGVGDTVAIIDAFDDPTAASDLATYRSFYNLPACTTAGGCFRKVNENGGSTPPSTTDSGWNQEISLDLDAVSAICPNCHILLVEANSTSSNDMSTAMQTAAKDGANQISASWTIGSQRPLPGRYTFPGIATVAAAGDNGYVEPGQDNFPAALAGVTAAGGTTLAPASGAPNARGFTEGAWSGGGSGCATEIAKPAYQSDTGCAGRTYADLSADADPNTGLAVYDGGSWLEIGGTSLATPMIAAYYAITGVADSSPLWAYENSGALNDVVSGSNGSNCVPSYLCNAGVGYDGPTGVGSISGAAVAGAPGIGGTYTESEDAHTATIAAGVYPNGVYTTWSIQYGTSTQYGLATSPTEIGDGSAPVAATGYLSGLAPSTTYHYRLVAQNDDGTTYGNDYTFTTSSAPASSPTAAFTLAPTAPAPSAPVTFDASGSTSGTATIQSYSWNFGDGSPVQTTSSPTITYTYANRGTYTVSLTVTNNAGKADTTTQTITVDDPPSSAFTPSTTVTTPDSVSLDGSASAAAAGGSITDYSWNFGDGNSEDTGTTATASHAYANPGTYTITLTTTDDLNVTSTATQTVTVAGFGATPTAPAPGDQVTFTGPNSGGSFGTITDYSWNFGDGNSQDTGTSPTATDTFSGRGTYTVSLTITNSAGATFTGTETITVDTAPDGVLPASPIIATPGQTVSLNGGNSTAPSGGSIESYTWNFGDGSAPVTSDSPSTTHVYSTPGTYTATLTVTDNLGVSAATAATQTVIVDQPAAAFTPSALTLTPNAAYTFDGSQSSDPEGTINGYSWSFGDQSPAQSGASVTHTYSQRGSYAVALTVTNSYGQTASTTHTVTVDDAPTAAFTPSPSVADTGSAVGFNAGASAAMTGGSIADYSWSFGDGTTEDTGGTATASHAYSVPGTYTVVLTTTDDLGVSATASEQVTIKTPPAPSAPPAQTPTTSSPAPAPTPTPTPTPTPEPVTAPSTPAPTPLSASLAAARKQRLAPALAHGMRTSLSVSQATVASFQITLPTTESRLAHAARKGKAHSIVLLRTGSQTLGAGAHPITLKLSRAAARELAAAGPLVVTVEVTLTEASGAKISRTVKIDLTR